MQIWKLQTYRHTSSEKIQACRPTGVKNYMLTDVFVFFSIFLSFFVSFLFFFFFLFFLEIKHTRLPPHSTRIEQYKTCCFFFFFKWNTSLTPYRHDKTTSCPSHRHKRTSTSLSPHRLNTNTQADSHTGNPENISSQGHRRKTTMLPPHRHNTKNYKLAAPQA